MTTKQKTKKTTPPNEKQTDGLPPTVATLVEPAILPPLTPESTPESTPDTPDTPESTPETTQELETQGGVVDTKEVSLIVPMADLDERAYQGRHIDLQLSPKQAITMRRLFDGLNGGAFKLQNGRFIQTYGDVVRWLMERIDESLEAPTPENSKKSE